MIAMTVPSELKKHVQAALLREFLRGIVYTLIANYTITKLEDSNWVVLPVASFDAHFGITSFGRKYLRLISEEILERSDSEANIGSCQVSTLKENLQRHI